MRKAKTIIKGQPIKCGRNNDWDKNNSRICRYDTVEVKQHFDLTQNLTTQKARSAEKAERALGIKATSKYLVITYLILASLNSTCLRTLGSNFLITIFSGMVRLFLVVV